MKRIFVIDVINRKHIFEGYGEYLYLMIVMHISMFIIFNRYFA